MALRVAFIGIPLGAAAAVAAGLAFGYVWGPTLVLLAWTIALLGPVPAHGIAALFASIADDDVTTALYKATQSLFGLVILAFFAYAAALGGLDLRELFPAFAIGWGWASLFAVAPLLLFFFIVAGLVASDEQPDPYGVATQEELVAMLKAARDAGDEPKGFGVIDELARRTRRKTDLLMSLTKELALDGFHYAPLVMLLRHDGAGPAAPHPYTIPPVCRHALKTPGFPKGLEHDFESWLSETVGQSNLEPAHAEALKGLAAHLRESGDTTYPARIEREMRRTG